MRTEKVVLIAGGAGSIGGALVERLSVSGMPDLIVLDKDENQLESLRGKFVDRGLPEPIIYVCDLRNRKHVSKILFHHLPDLVFNCAAHKHVVSGQRNVSETVNNNLVTTQNLLEAKFRNPEMKLVHISTDKAVLPSCVMGASKALCESMVRDESATNAIVRFGNVKGTRGSVYEVWLRQFAQKTPLTLTDPCMTRYIMTVQMACEQIMRVSSLPGGTYVLGMGKARTLTELLEEFKHEHSIPEDYPFVQTGAKHGEKTHEDLFWPCEQNVNLLSGNVVIKLVKSSPWFNYRQALEVSRDFDDAKTMNCLKGLFGKGMQ
jgi:FlaA1/EpsC-like NDP-sugar epimerase